MTQFLLSLLVPLAAALPLEGLTDLDGNPARLDHGKRTELVVFWATWCSTCKEKLKGELPAIEKEGKVAVITINTDRDPARVKHFLEKEGIKLPVLLDPKRKLRSELKAFSVPHWAVYKDGRLGDSAPAFERERVERAL